MTDLDALAVQVGREVARAGPGLGPGPGPVSGARAMLAKLREMGLVVEWRPIEEAPRDGSRIIVGRGDLPCDDFPNCFHGGYSGEGFWSDDHGGFVFLAEDPPINVYHKPTHFVDIPKGPGHD